MIETAIFSLKLLPFYLIIWFAGLYLGYKMDFMVKNKKINEIKMDCHFCGTDLTQEIGIYLTVCSYCADFGKKDLIKQIKKERDLWHINRLAFSCNCINDSCKICNIRKALIKVYEINYKEKLVNKNGKNTKNR